MAHDAPDMDAEAHDGQDIAEVFDEDNLDSDSRRLAKDDEELNFDDMPDVYDVTRADGDEDDDAAIIGDDLDDEEIVELSLDEEDEGDDEDEDDDYRASENAADDDEESSDEVELRYAGDLNTAAGARSGAQRYESRTLSDDDLTELGYKTAPKEPKSFERNPEAQSEKEDAEAQAKADHEDEQLDAGLEETFPASDPVSVKHIT
jgi:hypothetical protein